MTDFQTHVLIAAALVSGVSLLMFIIGWRQNARRLEQSRLDAQARFNAARQAEESLRYTPQATSSFEARLAASRAKTDATPVTPAPINLSKDTTTPVVKSSGSRANPPAVPPSSPSTYRAPARKRSGSRSRRGRSGSSYGGYSAGADCSTGSSGGSSCGGGGSSCGGGGGGE